MSPSPSRAARRPGRARRLSALALAVLLAASSSACVRGEETGGGTTAGTEPGSGQPALPECPLDALAEADGTVEVELWHALTAESEKALEDLAAGFNASQDQVEVQVRNQGNHYDEVLRKYVSGIPNRQLPAIAYLEDTTLRQLVDSGTILPAEACEKAEGFTTGQLPVVRDYYTADGVYWPGYPNVSTPIAYYNANHFRRAGLDPDAPPQTLDELREAAQALKDSGVAAPVAQILDRWYVESWVAGAGQELVSNGNGRNGPAEEATFDNPATHELYTWIDEMARDGLLEGYSATAGQINHFLAVAQQNSSLVIETSTASTTIKAVLGGTTYEEGAGIDVSDIDPDAIDVRSGAFPGLDTPAQVRVSGGAFYMTNTVAPEVQAGAWAFMRYMWETENQIIWHLQGSYLPTTQAAVNHPDVVDYWENDLAGRLLKTAYDQLLLIESDNVAPQMGPYSAFTDAIQNSLDRLVLNGEPVATVIADAQAEIQAALDRYIEDNP